VENAGHPLAFGLVALIALSLRRPRPGVQSSRLSAYWWAFGVAVALGLLTELAQLVGPRDASIEDFVNDGLGAALALAVRARYDRSLRAELASRAAGVALGAIALLSAALIAAPVVWAGAAYLRRQTIMPALAQFDSSLDLYLTVGRAATLRLVPMPSPWSQMDDHFALRVEPISADWPGVTIDELRPDWRRYSTLAIDVLNPNAAPLRLQVRVDDQRPNPRYGERYDQEFELPAQTRQLLRIPLREIEAAPRKDHIDLARMRAVVLFMDEASKPRPFYLGAIWLEP
jgi:hypothetical protein